MTGPTTDQHDGFLDGVLVLDLSRALAGPHAAMMLGDLGARVIKVETPEGGDDSRGWGPPFVGDPADRQSTYFLSANRNKESITLDLKDTSEGGDLEVLRRLVAKADVLVENFRTGVMDRLGLGVEALHEINPRLVICSITGFGHDGPEGGRAGYDQIAQGEAGLMSLTGPSPDQPTKVGVPIGDLLAGMNAAYGVVAALYDRERTGRGTVVRTSLLAAIVGVHAYQGTAWTVGGQVPRAMGNHHPSIAPYGLFATGDGAIQIAVGSEGLWRRLLPVLGEAAHAPEYATNASRVAHREQLIELLEGAFATRTSDDLLAELADLGIPAGKVRTLDDVYTWDQVRSQGLLVDVTDPHAGDLQLPGPPLRTDGPPGTGTRRTHAAPPRLGQHNDAIRAWLDGEGSANSEDGPRAG
ncbi:CaiB/BaiF CoA transferase family protein [Nocardioides sp. SYSU DS0663]|uniref:CaiB/BaiF CoA transferase family protein n=1 Tax=Nocardioides sp. SYSU DS0663 TaxID=3416445 RepID=UPI003F4B176C